MNKSRRRLKVILLAVFAAASLVALSSIPARAQCAMCRSAVSNSISAAKLARGLNLGTVILFIPPVTIFCAFFFVAYRRARVANPVEETTTQNRKRRWFHHAGRRGLREEQHDSTEPDNPSPLASPH
jgi:hypothetical protein